MHIDASIRLMGKVDRVQNGSHAIDRRDATVGNGKTQVRDASPDRAVPDMRRLAACFAPPNTLA